MTPTYPLDALARLAAHLTGLKPVQAVLLRCKLLRDLRQPRAILRLPPHHNPAQTGERHRPIVRPPKDFERIVNRTRYSVATANLLAGDDYWDGHNFERHGRNQFLYRTPKGKYFVVTLSQWQGESDDLTPCTMQEAIELYEHSLREHYEPYEVAFPDVAVVDA